MLAPLDPSVGPHPPAAVTLPSLADGGVRACLGTVFTEAILPGNATSFGRVGYPIGDADAARAAGLRQLACYDRWANLNAIQALRPGQQATTKPEYHATSPLRLGILVECADPIRTPDELPAWAARGVVAVGMAWAHGSRYAGGNGPHSCSTGITPIGRDFVRAMDSLNLIHDASHLSQRATDDLFSLTDRTVIASHSNCRALIDGRNERHLSDEAIREIGRRGGVIGLNLYSPFLRDGLSHDRPGRASIDDALAHVERIVALHGHAKGVGLGSDMDGGLGADRLPAGINSPSDLSALADGLLRRGWTDERVRDFAWGNWARFFGI